MEPSSLAAVELVVRTIAKTAVANEEYFCQLDAVVGDGDFGYSLARGFEKVLEEFASFDRSSPGAFLKKIGLVIASRVGGTSGPLWGTAFLRAGAQSVIAGLWAVNDSASLQLHSSLYRHLREGGEPAKALREAKLAMLHSGSPLRKPYYWGAWTLMEGRP